MCAGVGAESGEFALHHRADQFGELVRLFTDRSTGLDGGGDGDGGIVEGQRFGARIAEFDALRLVGSQRVFGALAECLALLFGDHSHDADHHAVGFWHVERDEIDTGVA